MIWKLCAILRCRNVVRVCPYRHARCGQEAARASGVPPPVLPLPLRLPSGLRVAMAGTRNHYINN